MPDGSAQRAAVVLLAIAAAGWYAASRAAAEALAGKSPSPGRRAIAYSLSVAMVVLVSIVAGKPEIAVGVIFATSVASLTLALGIVTLSASHTSPMLPRRMWSFVLPVALIALLIGFSGGIGWIQAAMLVLEGAALLMLWNDASLGQSDGIDSHPTEAAPPRSSLLRMTQVLVALVAAGVASWAGVVGASEVSASLGLPGCGLAAALMLSPALVLPMIGSGSAAADSGRYDHAVAAQIGFVLLNLCALLPLATSLWLTRPYWDPPLQTALGVTPVAQDSPATMPASSPSTNPTTAVSAVEERLVRALPYPLGVWRVDTVLLVALGVLLLPVALGRWTLGRSEGVGLLAAYTIYMMLTAYMAR